MELLTVSTSDFAGIPMMMGVDSKGNTYVKAVDGQNAVGKPDNSYRNFLAGKSPEALLCKGSASGRYLFKVPGYNKPVAFIPTENLAHYWIYQAKKGNKQAQVLITADLASSLDTQAKQTNGIQVTAAQHEDNRAKLRLDLISKWTALYDQGDRQEFYESATEEEQEAVFAKVSIQRYRELFPGCPKAKEAIKYHQGVLERLGVN